MATTFCPLCKSIMKDGICTNRKCGNSQFEIEFRNLIESIKKSFPKKYWEKANKSWWIDPNNLATNKQLKVFDWSIDISDLIENKVNISNKTLFHTIETNEPIICTLRYLNMKQAIRKVNRVYRHYLEANKYFRKINDYAPFIIGSNDLKNWKVVSEQIYGEDCFKQIKIMLGNLRYSLNNWTLIMIDQETQLNIKIPFTKEQGYELFKDREIKPNKKKRTALKHIVDDYERNRPQKILVKEHLKGDMVFEWRGITFKLYPPIIDEKRILKEG